jgi:serine/threonine protein kinase
VPIRGKYQALVADNAEDPAKALTAIAHLSHEDAFDPVPAEGLGIEGTRYEARWSESCERCGAIWIGTKAGEVLCLDLGHETPRVLPLTLDRGVRTLLHLHGPNAFGPDHCLLVGTDDGFLRRLHEVSGKLVEGEASWHVESWWAAAEGSAEGQSAPGRSARVIRASESIARTDDDRYTVGITAMARLRKDASGASPILITTRRGAIFLLEAEPGPGSEPARIRLRWLHTMTGWVQWILAIPDSDRIACISRGGELIRIFTADPALGIKTERLPLLPTSAAPFLEGFMLGTSEGLMYWSEQDQERSLDGDHRQRVVSLPITRSPVLCLDRLAILGKDRHGATRQRDYVILGLASGRLRMVRSDVVRDLAERRPPTPGARSRAVELGSSILAVEVLRPRGDDPSRCYVLVALQDHSLRLFHIESIENTEALIETHWRALGRKVGEGDDRRIAEALLSSATTTEDRDAIRYFLVQAIHPPIDAQDASYREWLLARIPTFLRQASPALLRLVALDLGKLARDDADALLEISLALLQALPERHAEWRRVAEQHLKVLNEAASKLTREDGARLIAWTRFARKYVILGEGFSEKKLALRSLVRMNYRTHKYLDALIYQALLFQRRHDLEWSADIEGEVHSLHTTESLVIAATRSGVLWFFSASGRRLSVVSRGVESSSVSIGIDSGHLLACAMSQSGDSIHLVTSWSSPFASQPREPTLSVFEIRHVVETGSPRREYVTARKSPVRIDSAAQGRPPVTVHSLCAVPVAGDLLLAGLDDAAYHFGIIKWLGDGWSLILVERSGASKMSQAEPSSLASGKIPSRAITASCLDKRGLQYLAAIGSDGGDVSFVWFDISFKVSRAETVAFRCPVNAIELSREVGAPKSSVNARDCYVGTATGETFAGSILAESGGVLPVWRETYDSSVVAVRLWRTPLYEDSQGTRQILVTATEKGRVCFHETQKAVSDAPEISELNNYSFRGLRLDQVNLPSVLTYFTVIDGTTDFVAAGPGGKIFKGSFCCTRDSKDRVAQGFHDEFPVNMWEAFNQIWQQMIRYDRFFFPRSAEPAAGPAPRPRELEILGLIRLESGALRRYLARRQLIGAAPRGPGEESFKEATRSLWSRDAREIGDNVRERLQGLRPEIREDRQQIKIVLKSLGRAFLDRRLESLLAEVESASSAQALSASLQPAHAAVRAAAEAMTGQIVEAARNPTSGAGKLRSSAFKELFRLQVFRHLALESGDQRPIRAALVEAIHSCLLDDDRLVRVETLRAMGITLRNLGVLRKQLSPAAGARLMEHLFRSDVSEILWLVSLLTENLGRYTDFSPGTTQATGWYYLSAILPIFVLFPESTLRLCDCITRGGVPVAALEVIATRLPGKVGARVRGLITKLYVVPCLRENAARKKFLNDYKKSTLEQWFKVETGSSPAREEAPSDHESSAEGRIASRLVVVYDELARFWELEHSGRMGNLPPGVDFERSYPSEAAESASGADSGGSPRSPIGLAEKVCTRLSDLARKFQPPCSPAMAGDNAKTDAIFALRSEIDGPDYVGLLQPVRAIACEILAHWQSFYGGKVPGEGASVGAYKLARCLGEGGYGRVYLADPGRESTDFKAAKVFRHIHDPEGQKSDRFLAGARRNRDLSGATGTRGVAPILQIVEKPHPCYLMPLRRYNLGSYAEENPYLSLAERCLHAVQAASDLGAGLATAHRRGMRHGDIKASNILVHGESGALVFELSDFEMAYQESGVGAPGPRPSHPPSVRNPRPKQHTSAEWLDACALARVLYQAFLRPPLAPLPLLATEEELGRACEHLASIPSQGEPDLQCLITALESMFDGSCPDARTFLEMISPSSDEEPQVPSRPLFSHDQLLAFIPPLIAANISPKIVFAMISTDIIGNRETGHPPKEQYLIDLALLSAQPASSEDHPLVTWLQTARMCVQPRAEASVYTDALLQLGIT